MIQCNWQSTTISPHYHTDATVLISTYEHYHPKANTLMLPSWSYHHNATVPMLPSPSWHLHPTVWKLLSQCYHLWLLVISVILHQYQYSIPPPHGTSTLTDSLQGINCTICPLCCSIMLFMVGPFLYAFIAFSSIIFATIHKPFSLDWQYLIQSICPGWCVTQLFSGLH